MSAHLQFGPEWMRKGRGKTSTSMGAASAGDVILPLPEATTPSIPNITVNSKSNSTFSKKHPSLGNLSANSAPSAHMSAASSVAPAPSPGAFSFAAAAAQAGSTKESNQYAPSSSTALLSSEGDSARYSKRLLSLYSSERSGPGSSPDSSSSATVQGNKSTVTNPANSASSSEREFRRTNANASTEGYTMVRPRTPPNVEARGLNARTTTSSSHEKTALAQRPGLFQRGSNGPSSIVTNASLSPTTLFQSRDRDRDRHGTGIQGGVLSGVAAPLHSRRRKESESDFGTDFLRSPRSALDADHPWDQRRTNDAFTSARNRSNRSNRTTTHDSISVDAQVAGAAGGVTTAAAAALTTPSVTSNGEIIETWSRLGGRRERAPGEGPIGPPSDHSGGFARFAGYERRRERQATMPATKQSSDAFEKKDHDRDEGHSSSDVDFSKHATYVLDSLRLDEDEEDLSRLDEQPALHQTQQQSPDWSPESQDWLYRDPSGQIQGPFKANLMQDWYAANYFDSKLLVRRVEDEAFQTLGETLALIGNLVSPFLIPPTAYVQRSDVQEQPVSFVESASQQQQLHANNPLGWPGNLDILNHYGNGSGHSSPFATPQGHFAELDNGHRMRQRTQQEHYNEVMRQRELAEQRAMYEQRAAQMAAMAMAQAQGRDPASLGLWGNEAMQGGEWNQMLNQPPSQYDRSEEMRLYYQQQQQQQQQQYYDQMRLQGQPVWQPENHNQGDIQEDNEQRIDLEQHAMGEVDIQQATEQLQEQLPQDAITEHDVLAHETVKEEEATLQTEPDVEHTEAIDEIEEEPVVIEEEPSPEQVWPQSPSAVEFASEPFMSEEQQWTTKVESPTRGKKSRRDRTKQQIDDEQDRTGSKTTSAIHSGSIKTVTEDQFRRSQIGSRENSASSIQTPLSSWLPDTPAGVAVSKSAPWANNTQDNAGLSLREIQEAEARQAEARKAARPRLQLNTPLGSEGGSLPTTMSWGLASSHSNNGREIPSSTPASAVTPAWSARQAPKKTLMEIQEEERKRAQKNKDAQAAQSEGKSKAYADSASKMQTSSNNGVASSWSVVGASGKPSLPTTVLTRPGKSASPIAQRTISSSGNSSSVAAPPGWSTAGNANGPNSKAQTTPRKGTVDNGIAPSAEFIRHCKEQLKGLNVKVDDFIEMLLSFPLDPSPDVVDIIAESVYASSSTLDGRRFAADFVAKRKLDANQGRGSSNVAKGPFSSSGLINGPASTSNARSLSDVLKTAPTSNNDGFGGFKVVKAKGAKKRQ